MSLFPTGSAILSPDGVYRYRLSRRWLAGGDTAAFIMLNPSTADATEDDPTIRRCVGFARAWGMHAIEVVNLYALRSTDPAALWGHPDPIGPENDAHILDTAERAAVIVAAWGAFPRAVTRAHAVHKLTTDRGYPLHVLRRTKDGHPAHPLYLPGELRPVRWT